MKILLWPTFYLPNIGGLEIMTHSLARQLQKEGHEIVVISDQREGGRFREFEVDGVRTFTFPFSRALSRRDLPLMKTVLTRVQDIFADFLPDVANVHGWFECMSFYQTRVLEKAGVPFCLTIHGLLEQEHYRTLSCAKLWAMAGAVNSVSAAIVEALKAGGHVKPDMRVIHNGSSLHELPPVRREGGPPQLLMAGRLSVEKRFDVGFLALKRLIGKHPDLRLTLVGGGEKFAELAELRRALGLDAHVEMTGYVPHHRVSAFIDEADVVLVPSVYESFCLVALEAAARGRPVAASAVLGLREVVADGTTGVLVPPGDPEALARAVDGLLSDPDRRRAMGRAARARAAERFGVERVARAYTDMYESVRAEAPCRR